jgi:O-antigen/teichoic acid export membrane protein
VTTADVMDQRSFVRRTGTIAVGQAVVKSSQLVITVVLVRLLAPDEWTRVAYLLSIYLAAVTLGTLNLQHGIVFFLRRIDPRHHRALVVQTAVLLIGTGTVIAAGLVAASPLLSGGRLAVGSSIPLLAAAILLELPTACAPAALIASDQLRLAAAWDITVTVVQISAVVLASSLGRGAADVVVGLLVAASIRVVLFAVLIARRFAGSLRGLPPGTLSAQIRYGVPLGLTLAASVLNRSVDKWFIAIFDTGNVGIYTVAAQEIPLLAVLPYAGGAAVVTLIVDRFHRGDIDDARRLWLRQTASMAAIVVPASAVLIVIAPELMVLVFGATFATGVLPFQLFTAITLHRVAEYGLVLRAADRNRELVRASVVLLVANTVLAGAGAATFGMVGASAGTLAANAIAWLFVLHRLGTVFGTTIRHTFAWRPWTVAVMRAGAAAITAFGVAGMTTSSLVAALVVKVAVFASMYAALSWFSPKKGRARSTTHPEHRRVLAQAGMQP